MRDLPGPDPGPPDHRSAASYLWWVVRIQSGTVAFGVAMGIVWMVAQALMPAAIGYAIQSGVIAGDNAALLRWAGILFALGVIQSVAGILRHRAVVVNYLTAAYRTTQLAVRQASHLGATLPQRLATGDVVSIGTNDINQIGNAVDITARGAGAVVAIIVVAVILLTSSIPIGLVVVLGVPVLSVVVGLLLRPLHHRQQAYREQAGQLAGRAADIVTGLRVLRGIGGEATFSARYAAESQRVRGAGVAVARVESWLEAAQVLLPGIFVALVTWLGARFALDGRINVGQLVAFYGYAVFLLLPLRTLTEMAGKITRGHVAAQRVVRLLDLEPGITDPQRPAPAPDATTVDLADPESGVVVRPGRLTALATARSEDAVAIADRLGRYTESAARFELARGASASEPRSLRAVLGGSELARGASASEPRSLRAVLDGSELARGASASEPRSLRAVLDGWDGVELSQLERATVRRLVLVADNEAPLFSGRLRDELLAPGSAPGMGIDAALTAASAHDVVDALPDGLDEVISERGREFSGGQQQRLRLARALLADPPILVLVEPTSAVDAHSEARIAAQLRSARDGRTTVVCTTSPLVLDQADHVIYVESGRVVAEGTHRDLLDRCASYAATVTRGEDQ
jgi:ABC-type multidrug transport system fused ATPase/permease subunit